MVYAYPRLDPPGIPILLKISKGKGYRDENRATPRKSSVEVGLVRWD